LPVTPTQPRKGDRRDAEDDGDEHGAHTVDEALDRWLGHLSRLDHADDASQRRFRADGCRPDRQGAFGVDGTSCHPVADLLRHRKAFAGDEGLVDMAAARDDVTVYRNAVSRANEHEVAHDHLLHRHLDIDAVAPDDGGGRAQGVQRTNGIGRLAPGATLEPLAEQHQRDDRGRGLEVQVRRAVPSVLEQEIHGEPVGGRRAECHEQVHVAGPGKHGPPSGAVEAPSQPELDRRRQGELHPAVRHPVATPDLQDHRHDERQGEYRTDRHGPPIRQSLGCCRLIVIHPHCGVARPLYRSLERGERHRRQRPYGCLLRGQVDRSTEDTWHAQQRLLHPGDARRACHSLDLQGHFSRRDVVAGLAHCRRQRVRSD
jgi:hypothetical protein